MDRKNQYKHQPDTPDIIREKKRNEQSELRKEKRDLTVSGKRIRIEENELEYEITESCVLEATHKLLHKSEDRLAQLRTLRQAFSQGTALIDTFIGVDGSVACLVGLLTGLDPELQLESAWCFTNMAAGTDDHAALVIKHAGAYLVTYLSSGNMPMQDQCAWAIGNLAGGSSECRAVLKAQGAILPLINLLKSPTAAVVQSASFALSNLARDPELQQLLVDNDIISCLVESLKFAPDRLNVIAEAAWVMTYLAAGGTYISKLQDAGIPGLLMTLVIQITSQQEIINIQVLTPALRCIGNIICETSEEFANSVICREKQFFATFTKLLRSEHMHLRKESLWVLSNISVYQCAAAEIVEAGLLPHIISLLSDIFDIRKEAAYCLCNMASIDSDTCRALYEHDALLATISLLKLPDTEIVHMALCLVEMILQHVPEGATQFEQSHGLDALETLEYSNNDLLRRVTNSILETHFYKDDE